MRTVNKAVLCCILRFKQWKKDRTVFLLFFSVFILIFYYTRDVYSFSKVIRESIAPWMFSAIFSDYIISMGLLKILLYFGVVLLFCNAPFADRIYTSVVLRSGRTSWSMGQAGYITLASLFYTFFIFISSIVVIFPRISFTLQWGKTIGMLALTDAYIQVPLLVFPGKVIANYGPIEATLWGILLVWLTCTLLGMILFCFNSIFNRKIGICLCCVLILIDPVVKWTEKPNLLRYSPVSWSSLENLATNHMSKMFNPIEAAVILLFFCITLSIVTILYHKMKPLEK